jgi:hypothetical protein
MRTDGTRSMLVHRGRLAAIGLTLAATLLASLIPQASAGPGDVLCATTGKCGRVHNRSDVRISVSNKWPPTQESIYSIGAGQWSKKGDDADAFLVNAGCVARYRVNGHLRTADRNKRENKWIQVGSNGDADVLEVSCPSRPPQPPSGPQP